MKVLVARCDRLGDLVLSLPVFAWLKQVRPEWEVHALVAPPGAALVEHDPHVDALYVWPGYDDPQLEMKLAAERYDAAIVLQYQTALARMLRRCRIRRRIGPLSKWSSWVLLNRGVVQGRSHVKRHESDYNLQLARKLVAAAALLPAPTLHLSALQREGGQRARAALAPGATTLAFVHPGSGGSALDWQPESFAEVANALARREGWKVLVTGSHEDRLAIDAMGPHLAPAVGVVAERFALREFLGLIAAGDLMIAPSTGPLHMAAALGLAAVGLYPPAPTMSARRWGPLGSWTMAVTPQVDCPAKRHCLHEDCLLFNCLTAIAPARVVEVAVAMVDRRREGVVAS